MAVKPGAFLLTWIASTAIILLLLLWWAGLGAQPLPIVPEVYPGEYIAWDPGDAASVSRTTHYEARIGDGAWTKVGLARRWKIPTRAEGRYMVYVRACYNTKCSGPAALEIRILSPESIPSPPSNLLPLCRTP
jgi:hypothetical protein